MPLVYPAPPLHSVVDAWNLTPDEAIVRIGSILEPAVLDLIEFKQKFTEHFCKAMKVAFRTLQKTPGRRFVLWGAELDPARMVLLQAFVVLIESLAAKSTHQGFVDSAYGCLARNARAIYRIPIGSGRPAKMSIEGERARMLFESGQPWNQVAWTILGQKPTREEMDRIRQAGLYSIDKKRRKQKAWRKLNRLHG